MASGETWSSLLKRMTISETWRVHLVVNLKLSGHLYIYNQQC